MADKDLQRTMFETSRMMDYFTERELAYPALPIKRLSEFICDRNAGDEPLYSFFPRGGPMRS
jgi:hypothetical protein